MLLNFALSTNMQSISLRGNEAGALQANLWTHCFTVKPAKWLGRCSYCRIQLCYSFVPVFIGVDLAGLLGASAEGGSVPSGVGYGERCPLSSRLRCLGERREAYFEGHRTLIFVPIWQNLGGGAICISVPPLQILGGGDSVLAGIIVFLLPKIYHHMVAA